jgi:type VI protein secretion system component Hcp
MLLRLSSCAPAAILAAALLSTPSGFAGEAKTAAKAKGITVTIDGLSCSSPGGSFVATEFTIAAQTSTSSGGGGAGAGKTTLTDLTIVKPHDDCSLPLFILAAKGQIAAQVVLTDAGKGNAPGLTMTLEAVQLLKSTLADTDSNSDTPETLELSYGAITITDTAGHTTGRIVR